MIEVRLDEICDVIAGQSPPSDSYNQDKIGVPFFQGKTDFGSFSPTVRYWCNKPTKISLPNDILFSVRAPVGPTNINNIEACIGRGLSALRCKKDVLVMKYLLHYLRANETKIAALGTGSTFKAITISELKKLQIPFPPLPQQQKIANILDAADDLRHNDKALLAKYDELKQSLFLDMFGDPVSNPKGWEVNNLKKISTKIHSGNTPKGGSEVYVKEGITFFRSQNVWKNRIVYEDVAFIDQPTHDKMMKSSLKHRDILMTKTGRINTENSSLGRAAMYLGEDDKANVNGHVYLIRLKKGIINEFVLHILTTKEYRSHIRNVCVGGIDKRQLNKDHIENFPIINPPIELQKQFTTQLAIIEQQKAITQKSLAKSEELFNSLLQKAFKGELSQKKYQMATKTNRFLPQSVSHPGKTLATKLEELKISPKDFAVRIGTPEKIINNVLTGDSPITSNMAVLFEGVLSIPAHLWLIRQNNYDEAVARLKRVEAAQMAIVWAKLFPYAEMAKLGWIKTTTTPEDKAEALFKFFRLNSPEAFEDYINQKLKVSFRLTLAHEKKPYAVAAWLRQGEIQASQLETMPYSKKILVSKLPEIKTLMAKHPADFFKKLQAICLEAGVKVVYTPCLKGASIHGSTRWLADTPLVQMSAKYAKNDIFWFTFFHELAHIIKHGKKYIALENKVAYDDESKVEEQEADDFAVKWTFSNEEEKEVLRHRPLKESDILRFAKKFNTHPAMIIGRFHHKKLLPFSIGNNLIEKIEISN